MKHFDLPKLYKIRKKLISENYNDDELLNELNEAILYKENLMLETSATGGLSVGGGMGAVVSGQPSGLAGATIGTNWASGGGTSGSGDVSIPYNPSGSNRVFQKLPMGKDHGPRTGKKSRTKKLDLKALKAAFAKRNDDEFAPKSDKKKVLDFNDFLKNDFTTIKK